MFKFSAKVLKWIPAMNLQLEISMGYRLKWECYLYIVMMVFCIFTIICFCFQTLESVGSDRKTLPGFLDYSLMIFYDSQRLGITIALSFLVVLSVVGNVATLVTNIRRWVKEFPGTSESLIESRYYIYKQSDIESDVLWRLIYYHIQVGLSLKDYIQKIVCDFFFFFWEIGLLWNHLYKII